MSNTISQRRAEIQRRSEEAVQTRAKAIADVAMAWKRIMLGADGKLHADARLVMRDLMNKSGFYSARQYAVGSPDATLALAAKRQLVTHILTCVTRSQSALERTVGQARGLDDDDHEDSDVEMTRSTMGEVYD